MPKSSVRLVLAFLVCAAPSFSWGQQFGRPLYFRAGYCGTQPVVADFTSDGFPDIVMISQCAQANSLVLFLGNGNEIFQRHANEPAGPTPRTIVSGDFNEDGKPDLAVVAADGLMGILLEIGDGTFDLRSIIGMAGLKPTAMVAADFNRDGHVDIAVADQHNKWVGVFTMDGHGLSRTWRPFHVGSGLVSLAAGDLNNDGFPDLVSGSVNGSRVAVLINNGDASFQSPIFLKVGDAMTGVAIGDLNHDGNPDLVCNSSAGNPTTWVLLGHGDGTFEKPVGYPTSLSPAQLALADFNRDGNLDVVITGEQTALFYGNGDGTLQPMVSYFTDTTSTTIAVADLNGDGAPDVVEGLLHSQLGILLNTGAH